MYRGLSIDEDVGDKVMVGVFVGVLSNEEQYELR